MGDLVVVVDMVNGFVNTGALADKRINKITPNIERILKLAKLKRIPVVAFRDCHSENDPEFKVFPIHCVRGSIECELIPELKKYEKQMLVIDKNTTNGFMTRAFKQIVATCNFDNVYVVGCCTDICVKGFVESYLKFNKANNRKTKIHVLADACYTFDGVGHNAEEEHQKALKEMQAQGAIIVTKKTTNLEK